MYWNQQPIPQQNQIFQPPTAPGQFGGGYYSRMSDQRLQRFQPVRQGQGSFQMSPGLGRSMNGFGGGQGYATPGYPPQGFGQPQIQQPMLPIQGNTQQGYEPYAYGFNQNQGQRPVQPAWEGPKKGGIKGFINNLMAKWTR